MKNKKNVLRTLNILLGVLSIALFIYIFFVIMQLKPKMVIYDSLTPLEEALMTAIGFALLVIMAFYLLSLWQFVRYIRQAEQIKPFPLMLIISGVLSFLFIFSDFALFSDIHKQYLDGLSQPEWSLVIPITAIQFIVSILFLLVHINGRFILDKEDRPTRDINIFLILQYIGVISGSMGFGLMFLGFFYPSGWSITLHGILGGIVVLFPYGLGLLYWLLTKLQEKDRQWFDEKQSQDLGKSALLTLSVDTILLIILFIINFQNIPGVICKLWLPIHLFTVVLCFSLGNIFFSRRS